MNASKILSVTLALSLFPLFAQAGLPDFVPLKARYKITVNGVPAGTAATVELKQLEGTRREVSFEVQNRFFRHTEYSRFDWNACLVTAREYRHDFHGLGIERHTSINFDWQRRVAIEKRTEKQQEIALPGEMYDGLNMAMLARCQLRDGARTLNFPVLYRSEKRDMNFIVTGEEKLETPVGTFDTKIIERTYDQRFKKTRVWVAPELDWFMVRFEHIENPAARGSLTLIEFSRIGQNSLTPPAKGKQKPVKTNPPG